MLDNVCRETIFHEIHIFYLIFILTAYKAEMAFKGLDFDADKSMQYKNIRLSMARIYNNNDPELPNYLCFGPSSIKELPSNYDDLSTQEQKEAKNEIKVSKELILKAHKRITEKIKEIRHNFSKAILSGRRSGSGKIIYEHYDKLILIWGSTPNVVPLKFGVKSKNFDPVVVEEEDDEDSSHYSNDNEIVLDAFEQSSTSSCDVLEEPNSDESCATATKTPKRRMNVVKLVDNKRRHMERNLSAAQRDQILINEAKEDAQFRKDLTQALRESTESFSNSIKEVSAAMMGIGAGISQSVQMLTSALLQPQPPNQPIPNPAQNIYYQGYPTNQGYFSQMLNSNSQTSSQFPSTSNDKDLYHKGQ